MPLATRIHRVSLRNYKSFAHCDVKLAPLTFVVGANGAGKSNFLDALRFVADALRTSLEHAVRERGGIGAICHRGLGFPVDVGIRVDLTLPTGQSGYYVLQLSAQSDFGFEIRREECHLEGPEAGSPPIDFCVENGNATWNLVSIPPAAAEDRLFLVTASGLPEFRPLYDALSRMGFYNLIPEQMREIQVQDAGDLLARSGSNLASVLARLASRSPAVKVRVEEYLAEITEGIVELATPLLAQQIALEFRQSLQSGASPATFLANNMSDGTLRALGILVALFQGVGANGQGSWVSLVGIEEPEMALHPGAAELLRGALHEASHTTQVLVTSHSPELLDEGTIVPESILAVVLEGGESKIGPLDAVGRSILRDRLFTAGELLRLKQLHPSVSAAEPDLFASSHAD